MRALRLQGHGSISFQGTSNSVCDAHGGMIDNVVPPGDGSSVLPTGEEDDEWNLGDIPLLRKADVFAGLHVHFSAIQTQCL